MGEHEMAVEEIADDRCVGTRVLFENQVVRVWEMRLAPGESSPAHRHYCDYVIAYATRLRAELLLDDEKSNVSYEQGHVAYYAVDAVGSPRQQLTNVGGEDHLHFVIELLDRNNAATPSSSERSVNTR